RLGPSSARLLDALLQLLSAPPRGLGPSAHRRWKKSPLRRAERERNLAVRNLSAIDVRILAAPGSSRTPELPPNLNARAPASAARRAAGAGRGHAKRRWRNWQTR